jgi:hypothetical protein
MLHLFAATKFSTPTLKKLKDNPLLTAKAEFALYRVIYPQGTDQT